MYLMSNICRRPNPPPPKDGRYSPNPNTNDDLGYFRMIGRMVGFALGSGDTFPCFFSTFVLKHLLGIPLRLEVSWFDIGFYCSACANHGSLERLRVYPVYLERFATIDLTAVTIPHFTRDMHDTSTIHTHAGSG